MQYDSNINEIFVLLESNVFDHDTEHAGDVLYKNSGKFEIVAQRGGKIY